jgi:hypothetical protein
LSKIKSWFRGWLIVFDTIFLAHIKTIKVRKGFEPLIAGNGIMINIHHIISIHIALQE